ncbi:flagellar biosynthesis anti-sigma factor FlgM [Ferrimonas pelagia]|uniref:Negative regulator of flagellin synthesis n=1 Tax=Ferrimonas pelagia TaxID=1177826 RepID=A0ABP9EYW6_9GAMM
MAIDLNNLIGGAPRALNQHTQAAAHKAPQAEAQPHTHKGDEVVLTEQAQQLKRAEASLASATGIDQAKVDSIKAAIAEGRYHVDPEKLADNIARFESELDGLMD